MSAAKKTWTLVLYPSWKSQSRQLVLNRVTCPQWDVLESGLALNNIRGKQENSPSQHCQWFNSNPQRELKASITPNKYPDTEFKGL